MLGRSGVTNEQWLLRCLYDVHALLQRVAGEVGACMRALQRHADAVAMETARSKAAAIADGGDGSAGGSSAPLLPPANMVERLTAYAGVCDASASFLTTLLTNCRYVCDIAILSGVGPGSSSGGTVGAGALRIEAFLEGYHHCKAAFGLSTPAAAGAAASGTATATPASASSSASPWGDIAAPVIAAGTPGGGITQRGCWDFLLHEDTPPASAFGVAGKYSALLHHGMGDSAMLESPRGPASGGGRYSPATASSSSSLWIKFPCWSAPAELAEAASSHRDAEARSQITDALCSTWRSVVFMFRESSAVMKPLSRDVVEAAKSASDEAQEEEHAITSAAAAAAAAALGMTTVAPGALSALGAGSAIGTPFR